METFKVRREVDPECNCPRPVSYAMWSDPALFELRSEGANFDVMGGDHKQVTWFELKVASVLVSVALLTFLSGFHTCRGSLRVHVPMT
jgi:hypothetical protein